MKIHTVAQRSPEWFALRLGKLTGSAAADMLATIKTGEAAAKRDLRMKLVCERLTGQPQENGFTNAEMQRGVDLEPKAVAAYETRTGHVVNPSGFLSHDTLAAGCSLDGEIDGYTGVIEIKCPKSSTHIRYLRQGWLPTDYTAQVTHNLWISGAQWCDFLSYDDRFPVELQTFLVRVPRDEKAIAAYEAKALAFLAEVATETQAIRTMANPAGVLAEAVNS